MSYTFQHNSRRLVEKQQAWQRRLQHERHGTSSAQFAEVRCNTIGSIACAAASLLADPGAAHHSALFTLHPTLLGSDGDGSGAHIQRLGAVSPQRALANAFHQFQDGEVLRPQPRRRAFAWRRERQIMPCVSEDGIVRQKKNKEKITLVRQRANEE